MQIFLVLITFLIFITPSFARGGYDYSSGSFSDIEASYQGNSVDVYDYSDGTRRSYPAYNVDEINSTDEIELYDYNTGQYKYYDMD